MKKSLLILPLLFAGSLLSAQNGKVTFTKKESKLDAVKLLRPLNNRFEKNVVFQPEGGVTGGCYKAAKEPGTKGSVSVTFRDNPFLDVPNASSPLSFKLSVKGKGSFRMTFCCYDKWKKYFTQMDKNCRKVDTAGKWQTFEFNYTPRPNNTAYLTKIAYVIPLFILDAGEFCLDDWSGEVKVPSAKIQLDD